MHSTKDSYYNATHVSDQIGMAPIRILRVLINA